MLALLRSKQTFEMVTGILFSLVTLTKNDQYFKKSVNLAKNMKKVKFQIFQEAIDRIGYFC